MFGEHVLLIRNLILGILSPLWIIILV